MSQSYTVDYWKQQVDPSPPFPKGDTAYRPLLKIELTALSTGKKMGLVALADTGADDCTFPFSFLAPLGLDHTKMPMRITGGLGSDQNETFYETVQIRIPFLKTGSESFTTFAGFTKGLDKIGCGLLGQRGFFETFKVIFDGKQHLLKMQRH